MNQEKIGKFISECRIKKKLTQNELAIKLNVSNKTISKWENGHGLPDISLLKPLCNELGITINELFNGEKIEKQDYSKKSEETIINTIKYKNKKIKQNKIISITILIVITIVILIIYTLNMKRISNNEPVIFNTWGYYNDSIVQHQKDILRTSNNYLIENCNNYKYQCFISEHIYKIEEGKSKSYNKIFYIYEWVLEKKYTYGTYGPTSEEESSIPHKITVGLLNNKYFVIDDQVPEDNNYSKRINELFPKEIKKEMDNIYTDGTHTILELNIEKQVEYYYHTYKPIYTTLNKINTKIIEYTDTTKIDYYVSSYINTEKGKVIVVLNNNSENNQKDFKKKIINSEYIEFIEE